jgi:hypothetical protein
MFRIMNKGAQSEDFTEKNGHEFMHLDIYGICKLLVNLSNPVHLDLYTKCGFELYSAN